MKSRTFLHTAGLTLIELLVVLTILAVVAGIAVSSTEGLVDQSRYEATQRTLSTVEEALVGVENLKNPDNTLLIAGFVADVGRLPKVLQADPQFHFEELFDPLLWNANSQFHLQTVQSDTELQMLCGWRGPYVKLSTGASVIKDGWGNPLLGVPADGNFPTTFAPFELGRVRSFGADANLGDNGQAYAADLDRILDSKGNVYGTVDVTLAAGEKVFVRVYGPKDGIAKTIAQSVELTAPQYLYSLDSSIGPRIVRAYKITGDLPLEDQDLVSISSKSKPVWVNIPGNVSVNQNLLIP